MERKISQKVKEKLPKIKRNVYLKNYTTFRIGGPAKYFFVAKNKKDLILAIKVAKELKLPFFILGNGSNILVSDSGYKGLVIKIQNTLKDRAHKALFVRPTGQAGYKNIYAESGIKLSDLVKLSIENLLAGFEWAIGIPGTLGGAVRGNAGAFGKSMKNVVEKVEFYDTKKQKINIFENKKCKFGYRNSIFKKNKNLIITSFILRLKKGQRKEIEKKIKEYSSYRREKQPLNFLSAGSVFENPSSKSILSSEKKLLKEFPELKEFNKKGVIPAGWLIEKCGLKGKKIGGAKISEVHANFIVNLGKAKAEDVKKLIKLVKRKVKNKFGIVLKEELQYL